MDAEQTQEDALTFGQLWDKELDEIQSSREKRQRREPVPTTEGEPRERACGANLVGLAFSGGGIRSATFNLGILQALAQLGLLRRFDYLSTVSGGGYIGSWLAAWMHRDGIRQAEEGVAPQPVHGSSVTEHEAVRFLRTYSNYLTPRLGLFSLDTWTMVSVYLRNLVLNQGVLVLALAALLMAPRCLVHCSALLARHPAWAIGAAVLLVLLALINVGLNLLVFRDRRRRAASETSQQEQQDQAQSYPRYTHPAHVLGLIVVPLVIAAWLLSCALWSLMGWPDQ
ncbi:MAG: patatin-like phospholipase family protein, partial [Anaerolineae bacterium]|nr:patatin-like phospholipase family protein [Anaerolineae bacterium]